MSAQLYLTERHRAIAEATRDFAEREIRPIAGKLDETEEYPAGLYKTMCALGMMGVTVPESLGGAGADALGYALVIEELSRGYASVADQCGLIELVGTLLAEHGAKEQHDKYLRPLLKGERRCAYAITEAEAGSDVSGIKTAATPLPGGGWRLDGG